MLPELTYHLVGDGESYASKYKNRNEEIRKRGKITDMDQRVIKLNCR